MRLLAIDTSTAACSCALSIEGRVAEHFELPGRRHGERLLPMVQALLAQAGLRLADLDALACAVGPGSFAGLRIGVGYCKGVGLALDLPVLGVSTLAMLAQDALDAGATLVLPCIDARVGEVYFGAYASGADGLALPLQPEAVSAPDQVRLQAADPREAVGAGSGWGSSRERLESALGTALRRVDAEALPRAAAAAKLALPRLAAGERPSADALVPTYLRDRIALTLAEQAIARRADRG